MKYILVFDLGERTCDVSVLKLDGSLFEVILTVVDNHFGGQDFDNKLVEYCIKEFKYKTDIDISNNHKALRRLKLYCEKVKWVLSLTNETSIEIDNLVEVEDFNIIIYIWNIVWRLF